MRRTIGVKAAVTVAAGVIAATPAAASPAQYGPTAALATNDPKPKVHRKHHKCDKPKGKRLNVSWADGISSTTFYFNNHCRETNRIRVWYANGGRKCKAITVKPGIQGRKKLARVFRSNLMHVDFGKCPYWP